MVGDKVAAVNFTKVPEITACLSTMTNDFEYIESVVQSWLRFAREGNPYSNNQRKNSAEKFCTILEALEKLIGFELPTRNKFEKYIYSDAYEDWEAIFLTVLPRLRGEILGALQKALRALPFPIWSGLLPEAFASQVIPPFCQEQYLSAVRRGCDALRAVIRTKTGLHDLDGAALVNQAYGKDSPFAVAVWEGHSEDDVRRGYADMLRGAMMAIRNPHYHGTEELTEPEAARLLVMLGILWARADSTTKI